MTHRVHLIADAEADLLDIYDYVAQADSVRRVEGLLTELERACLSLDRTPARGHYPPELERIGVLEYRELHVHSYRILYEIDGDDVFVHAILDGRRDLQTLLMRRLLRP